MRKTILAAIVLACLGAGTIAPAQVRLPTIPRIGPRGQPPPPMTIEMLQADLVAKTGSDMVYFAGTSHGLTAAGQTTLVVQAQWLLANPAIRARIEGHADERTPRDYALAVGERRADAVRDFLVLQGVQPGRLTIVSWGKERPAVGGSSEEALALNRRARTVLVP
jgi:peptidoglycan-associated lipoprotein